MSLLIFENNQTYMYKSTTHRLNAHGLEYFVCAAVVYNYMHRDAFITVVLRIRM